VALLHKVRATATAIRNKMLADSFGIGTIVLRRQGPFCQVGLNMN